MADAPTQEVDQMSEEERRMMAEWEAMACNVSFVNVREREFEISANPRDCVFDYGWDRRSTKVAWEKYLAEKGVE